MTADLPQSCPRRWTSTCQADLSVSRRPWRKIEPAGRTERNYLLASPEGCGIMLRVHEKCPSFIQPLWIRSCIPTDLLCANWGIKKKKKKEAATQRRDEDGDDVEAVVTLQVCGGGNFQWATGELKRTQRLGEEEGKLKSQRCVRLSPETEEVMTASPHLDPGLLLLLLLACWQTPGMVGASESLSADCLCLSVSTMTFQLLRSDDDEILHDKQRL